MPEQLIVSQCAPVLAGIKTANLFNAEVGSYQEFIHQIAWFNQHLAKKDLHMMVLSYPKGRALVYVFRAGSLKKDFLDGGIQKILRAYGYDPENIGMCLTRLIGKLNHEKTFPHEIGCFLGYPSEDIEGFLYHDRPRKCVGVWQVYGDEAEARHRFRMYRICTDDYEKRYAEGCSIEDLSVDLHENS
jgi:hypothetical protein